MAPARPSAGELTAAPRSDLGSPFSLITAMCLAGWCRGQASARVLLQAVR